MRSPSAESCAKTPISRSRSSAAPAARRCCPTSVCPHEVDEAGVDVHIDQLQVHPLADVQSIEAMHDLPFDRRMKHAGPRPLRARAGDDPVEALADAVLEQTGGR